jgi:hypothetical protein
MLAQHLYFIILGIFLVNHLITACIPSSLWSLKSSDLCGVLEEPDLSASPKHAKWAPFW